VCGVRAAVRPEPPWLAVSCVKCGAFRITIPAAEIVGLYSAAIRQRVSSRLRRAASEPSSSVQVLSGNSEFVQPRRRYTPAGHRSHNSPQEGPLTAPACAAPFAGRGVPSTAGLENERGPAALHVPHLSAEVRGRLSTRRTNSSTSRSEWTARERPTATRGPPMGKGPPVRVTSRPTIYRPGIGSCLPRASPRSVRIPDGSANQR
jgi:hypothetical protein